MSIPESAGAGRIRRVWIISLLFVGGVLTQNVQLLPLGSEYQPWIYSVVVPFVAWAALMRNSTLSRDRVAAVLVPCIGLIALLLVVTWQTSMLPPKDALRVVSLPLVATATWIYLREVPASVVRLVTALHVAFLVLALLAPDFAAAVSATFGSRGEEYYLGWNSYFYSEPSYAALTFLILAFFRARDGRLSLVDTLALMALLASTMSVTGLLGAALLVGTFVWQRSKVAFAGTCAGIMLGVLSVSLIPQDTSIRSLQRLAALAEVVDRIGAGGMESALHILNVAEPSGMWRAASNLYAMSCADTSPLGLGNTDLYAAIERSDCSTFLASLLQQNATFIRLGPGASAQSVFGNLAIFAGIPGMALGMLLLTAQMSAFRHRYVRDALPLSLAFVLFFIIWQSAWAAPTSSIMIAAAYGKGPHHG